MKRKVTIYDVAKKIGVSTATVNRALNGKPRISEETRQHVIRTANELGYKANKAAMSLNRKTIRIGFIMHTSLHSYDHEVVKGAMKAYEALADFNVQADFQIVDWKIRKNQVLKKLKEMGKAGYDGIILCPSVDDIREYSKVINELFDRNIYVVLVISDIPDSRRLFSVRNNGRVSGRIAAELLGIMCGEKPVAIFTGFMDRGIHKENIEGFMEQQKENPLNLVAIYENRDDPAIAYSATEKLLKEHPDIAGLYIGSANSVTVCKKLVESGAAGRISIVASDVFPEVNGYLKEGVINATIFQDPFNQGRLAFEYLYEHIAEGRSFDSSILLNPQVVLKSNLELFAH